MIAIGFVVAELLRGEQSADLSFTDLAPVRKKRGPSETLVSFKNSVHCRTKEKGGLRNPLFPFLKESRKMGDETDKISSCNTAELQDVSSFKNPKYPQKYPHSKNILVDVKTACWTKARQAVLGRFLLRKRSKL
ncbi:hypothetical protein [Mailhella sp.]